MLSMIGGKVCSGECLMARQWRPFLPCRPPLQRQAAAGIALIDPSGRVLVASEQAAHLLGVSAPTALVGREALFDATATIRPDGTLFPVEDQPGGRAARTGRAQRDVVLGVNGVAPETLWLWVRAEPLTRVGATSPYAVVVRFAPAVPADPCPTEASRAHARSARARSRRD
jgi:PAS domain-containing protein